MKKIPLTQGQFALVDDADYHWLNRGRWYALYHPSTKSFYAQRKFQGKIILMHRMILGLTPADKKDGDHKNGVSLDNRRCNIRKCTRSQNLQNAHRVRAGTSKYKGVSFYKKTKKWQVHIMLDGKRKHLGYFHNESYAAHVYDTAAKQLYGEFACFNFK
jgi:hypothetical protein